MSDAAPRVRTITVERTLVLTPRTCAQCATAFEGWGRQRFCSKRCQRHWDYRRHAERRREARRERYRRQQSGDTQEGS